MAKTRYAYQGFFQIYNPMIEQELIMDFEDEDAQLDPSDYSKTYKPDGIINHLGISAPVGTLFLINHQLVEMNKNGILNIIDTNINDEGENLDSEIYSLMVVPYVIRNGVLKYHVVSPSDIIFECYTEDGVCVKADETPNYIIELDKTRLLWEILPKNISTKEALIGYYESRLREDPRETYSNPSSGKTTDIDSDDETIMNLSFNSIMPHTTTTSSLETTDDDDNDDDSVNSSGGSGSSSGNIDASDLTIYDGTISILVDNE